MRRKEQEITDQSEILDIISEARVCRIGLVDGYTPYVVPVNFGFKNNIFYFHGAKSGKKIDTLRKNPAVCVEIDILEAFEPAEDGNACDYGFAYRSIIARGTARCIEDPGEKKEALTVIVKKYAPDNPCDFPEASLNGTAVFAVAIEEVTAKRSS